MKTIPFNSEAIPGSYRITYRVRDAHRGYPIREVEVLATPEEIAAFVQDGYLVRERLIPMDQVERLRCALDEAIAADTNLETGGGRAFGGIFIRHLLDKHPTFLELLTFQPTLSVARALLGPSVQWRGLTGRVCFPDDPNKETEWHFHQRVVPDPLPPFFARPETLEVLLYLDDINEKSGPLCILPGSHRWLERDLDKDDFDDKPGQIVLKVPAGSAVIMHGSLWHRAMPTLPGCSMRRLLLWSYGPTWQKPSIYGVKPTNGLTAQLLADPNTDEEIRELLGVAGYM
jgi:hypothetical protein